MEKTIAIIGAGKVGSSLALILNKKGYSITGIVSRSKESAEALGRMVGNPFITTEPDQLIGLAAIIIISTPDGEIEKVANKLARVKEIPPGTVFIHTSGALTSEVLAPLQEKGGVTFSLHPLQSFACIEGAVEKLPDAVFTFEGDKQALGMAQQLVEDIGGQFLELEPSSKALYHGAACIAANYLVTLAYTASNLLERVGFESQQAQKALLPLMQGVLDNIKRGGIIDSLTGPIARGDEVTISRHLSALDQYNQETLDLYCVLGHLTTEVALKKGTIDDAQLNSMVKLLKKVERG